MTAAPTITSASHVARELVRSELPRLQALFDANPEYFVTITGAPPGAGEAEAEFDELPPAHIPHGRRWFFGFFTPSNELEGVGIVVRDLGAAGVWHIALYFWANRLHGAGVARTMHGAIQDWASEAGARWLRISVIVGNRRAERFWSKLGYVEVRRRENVPAGARVNTARVMVKPLFGQPIAEYLALVPRDRPDSPLP